MFFLLGGCLMLLYPDGHMLPSSRPSGIRGMIMRPANLFFSRQATPLQAQVLACFGIVVGLVVLWFSFPRKRDR